MKFSYLTSSTVQGNIGLDNENNRKQWISEALALIPAGKSILDAGAGELANKEFCSHLNYVSQDICQYDGKGDGLGLHMENWNTSKIDLISDINSLPLKDSCFDAIVCTEVIEHIPSPTEALSEFYRILSPGGVLILTAPFCSLTHFAPYHFASGYNSYYYTYHLTALGFRIKEIRANGNYFSYLAQETRRLKGISYDYANYKFSLLDKFITFLMIKLLGKISKNDRDSSSILCYGYHVIAEKVVSNED